MKKYLILCYLFLFISLVVSAQHINEKKATLFKEEVDSFRYKLYKDLDKISDENLINYTFENADSLIASIDNCCSSHEKEIINYRLSRLKQFSGRQTPDLKNYKEKTDINTELIHKNKELQAYMPFTKLLFIDPFQHIRFFNNYFIASNSSVKEVTVYNIRNMIASPFISMQRIFSTEWEITLNTYHQIIQFRYEYKKGEIIDIKVYELKGQE